MEILDGHGAATLQDKVDALTQQIAERDASLHFAFLQHRPKNQTAGRYAISEGVAFENMNLARRIMSAHRAAQAVDLGPADSFWLSSPYFAKQNEHNILMGDDVVAAHQMLMNPEQSELFIGFDNLNAKESHKHEQWLDWCRQWAYDNLLRFAEAVGVRRMAYPELQSQTEPKEDDTDRLLSDLDDALGFRIEFPNPFAGETGLVTSRGIASYRAVQALYQAWRISELIPDKDASVLEIGAGLGRTAYNAFRMGITNYRIIDLPMTAAAQAIFLARTLGDDAVSLHGENRPLVAVQISPPSAFLEASEQFDLIVNVDSLTEMDRETATDYCRKASTCSKALLSINHEFNTFTARDVFSDLGFGRVTREAYWMRRGYVEEVATFRSWNG